MKARNGLGESIRELFSIPMTCNALGMTNPKESPRAEEWMTEMLAWRAQDFSKEI